MSTHEGSMGLDDLFDDAEGDAAPGDLASAFVTPMDPADVLIPDWVDAEEAKAPVVPVPAPKPAASQKELKAKADWEKKQRGLADARVSVDQIKALINKDAGLSEKVNEAISLTQVQEEYVKQLQELKTLCSPVVADRGVVLPGDAEGINQVFTVLYDDLVGLGVLGDLWRDSSVTEIMVDGPHDVVVERNGELEKTPVKFKDLENAKDVLRSLAQKSGRTVNETSPLVTAQLPGARLQFVYGDLSARGLAVTIRKFKPLLDMAGLQGYNALDDDMVEFLSDCVGARASVVVSGGTGTGKTTMINALSEYIGAERVVTIEDAYELNLANAFVVNMQSKEKASADDAAGSIPQGKLLKAALRMRPDRIIVGEIRDPEACNVWLDAANTGHDGGVCSIHANSPTSAVNARLTSLLMRNDGGFSEHMAQKEVATAVDLVVHIARKRSHRYVESISVIDEDAVTDGNGIVPNVIFEGRLDGDERVFERIGDVGADTALFRRLEESNVDTSKWSTR